MQVLSRLSIRPSKLEHLCHRQTAVGNISAAYANLPMFFQDIRHDPFKKNVEESG